MILLLMGELVLLSVNLVIWGLIGSAPDVHILVMDVVNRSPDALLVEMVLFLLMPLKCVHLNVHWDCILTML